MASKWVRRLIKIPVTSYGYGGVLVAVSPDRPGIAELPMLGFLMVILVTRGIGVHYLVTSCEENR